jgi:PhnB protein
MSKPTLIHPYLFFPGNCAEAVKFYCEKLGGEELMTMCYKDSPEPPPPGMVPENWGDKVMHTSFKIGGNMIMASDGCGDEAKMSGFSLSIALPDEAAAHKAFNALAEGGKINMPLTKTFWSPCFGMLQDKFGLNWMVSIVDDKGCS